MASWCSCGGQPDAVALPSMTAGSDPQPSKLAESVTPASRTSARSSSSKSAPSKASSGANPHGLTVAVIGAGAWSTTLARVAADNAAAEAERAAAEGRPSTFVRDVLLYARDEELPGGKMLVDVMQQQRVNVKYLPGFELPRNLQVSGDLRATVAAADLVLWCVPHQFLGAVMGECRDVVRPGSLALSAAKGLHPKEGKNGLLSLETPAEQVEEVLKIPCCALSGANVADQIARGEFAESTIGYGAGLARGTHATLFRKLLHTTYLRVDMVSDRLGVELGGSLKNLVAVAAGIADGLDLGSNTKAALLGIGLREMRELARALYPKQTAVENTWFHSCGVADLFTTCAAGRNRAAGEALARATKNEQTVDHAEAAVVGKLQGPDTAKSVYEVLASRKLESRFPLFVAVYRVCFQGAPPDLVITQFSAPLHHL